MEHTDAENSYQKLSWASGGNLISLGFMGTAPALQRLRYPGKPEPGGMEVDLEQGILWGSPEMQHRILSQL